MIYDLTSWLGFYGEKN